MNIRKALSSRRLFQSVWLFPVLLGILVLGLSVLKISGSSVGMYHQVIYGPSSHDPDLLYGHPKPIRSDEWLATTQLTIAQHVAGYPRINNNLGYGRDMSLTSDAPYKDWSTIFKPQNLSFLIAPFDNAFAFKWWFLLYMLIISCYFFTLRIFKGKRLFGVLFSVAIGLSPFVFWWYETAAIAPLFYGFFLMLLGMRIINGEPVAFLRNKKLVYSSIVYAIALAYLLMSFALVLYPPFQIPVAIVVTFFLFGYFLNHKFNDKSSWKEIGKKLLVFGVGLILVGILLGTFISTRKGAVHSITNTVYPAARIVSSGHINSLNVFDSFLQPQLQSETRGTHFFNNQSESSNFILLSPFLIIPAISLSVYEFRKYRRIDWLFVMIEFCVLIFFARIFVPFGDSFYNLLFLNRVPHERLMIGIGLAGILLILLILKKLTDLKLRLRTLWLIAGIYSLVCLAIVISIGFHVSHLYPLFISYTPKILLLASGFCAIIFLILVRQMTLAAVFLLLFSLGCVVKIHPLYRGLGWIENNTLFSKMQAISKPGDTWVSADSIVFENFGLLADRDSLSGVQPYPDLSIWRQIEGPQADDIYNRYAHVLFISNPSWTEPLHLVQPDLFEVGLSCSKFITTNVDFVLDTVPLNKPCLEYKDKISYPGATFYIYGVHTPST